jgi:hypothetical protein
LRGDEFCGNRGFGHLLFNLTARNVENFLKLFGTR